MVSAWLCNPIDGIGARHLFVPEWYPINQDADMDANGIFTSDDAIWLLQHILMPQQFPLK